MSASHEPLTPLLASAKAGLPAALEKLMAVYRPRLMAQAVRDLPEALRGKVGASDLVQDSMMQACKCFEQFRGGTSAEFAMWLQSIYKSRLSNLVAHYLDVQSRDAGREVDLPAENIACPKDDAAGQLIEAENVARLHGLIGRLPEKLRLVVHQHAIEQREFAEIALQAELTEDAVRKRWFRGLLELKKKLPKPGESDAVGGK